MSFQGEMSRKVTTTSFRTSKDGLLIHRVGWRSVRSAGPKNVKAATEGMNRAQALGLLNGHDPKVALLGFRRRGVEIGKRMMCKTVIEETDTNERYTSPGLIGVCGSMPGRFMCEGSGVVSTEPCFDERITTIEARSGSYVRKLRVLHVAATYEWIRTEMPRYAMRLTPTPDVIFQHQQIDHEDGSDHALWLEQMLLKDSGAEIHETELGPEYSRWTHFNPDLRVPPRETPIYGGITSTGYLAMLNALREDDERDAMTPCQDGEVGLADDELILYPHDYPKLAAALAPDAEQIVSVVIIDEQGKDQRFDNVVVSIR